MDRIYGIPKNKGNFKNIDNSQGLILVHMVCVILDELVHILSARKFNKRDFGSHA